VFSVELRGIFDIFRAFFAAANGVLMTALGSAKLVVVSVGAFEPEPGWVDWALRLTIGMVEKCLRSDGVLLASPSS
jgi:hypothetical protein